MQGVSQQAWRIPPCPHLERLSAELPRDPDGSILTHPKQGRTWTRPAPKDTADVCCSEGLSVVTGWLLFIHSGMILFLHEDAFLPLKLMGVMWLN